MFATISEKCHWITPSWRITKELNLSWSLIHSFRQLVSRMMNSDKSGRCYSRMGRETLGVRSEQNSNKIHWHFSKNNNKYHSGKKWDSTSVQNISANCIKFTSENYLFIVATTYKNLSLFIDCPNTNTNNK